MIESGYKPGSIGRIAELHGTYYHVNWGFGLYFEAKVATELSEFLQRFNHNSDGFWIAVENGRIEGAVAIDGICADKEGAHLRWFILSDALRGKGVGRRLINKAIDFCRGKGHKKTYLWTIESLKGPEICLFINKAIDFCRGKGHKKTYLWTFEGLNAARHLYEEVGFHLVKEQSGVQWGRMVNEQYFELSLGLNKGDFVV